MSETQTSDPVADAVSAMRAVRAPAPAAPAPEVVPPAPAAEAAPAPADAPAPDAPPVDAAPEAKPEETKPEEVKNDEAVPKDRLSTAWAGIAKAEKKNRDAIARLKSEREAFEAKQKEFTAQLDAVREIQRDPVAWAEKHFGDPVYEAWTKRRLTGEISQPTPAAQGSPELVAKLEALEKRLAETEQFRQQSQIQDQVRVYTGQVDAALKDPKFSLLASVPGAQQEVMKFATMYVQETGNLIDPNEAAQIIQDTLKEQLAALKDNAEARQIFGAHAAPASAAKPATKAAPSPTLTNSLSASPPADGSPLSEEERIDSAVKAMRAARSAVSRP